mmetsp:Transcript_27629/g.48813  ORF Transcript_27629/g.48813 Transcript_27629/m.48813 type:complete len:184 (+) Transcript_27629:1-552(+)
MMHTRDVPHLAKYFKYQLIDPEASKEVLQGAWKQWVSEAIEVLGGIPDGNMKGNKDWAVKKVAVKPELKVTAGKGLEDLSVSLTDLLTQIVSTYKVVAFIKGTRTEPQCGFSYSIVSELTRLGCDFEVINVLDEIHNPGVRDAIKEMSDWPTIPQLYVGGEFVGGSDIVSEMATSGQLKDIVL